MKVLIEGEVVEQHKGELGREVVMYVVRLDTGFGSNTVPVAKDKAVASDGFKCAVHKCDGRVVAQVWIATDNRWTPFCAPHGRFALKPE